MKVLHIDCSLRHKGSVSRQLSQAFVDKLRKRHSIEIDRLDLAVDTPPHISQDYAQAMYVPMDEHTTETKKVLALSNKLVDRLFEADLMVLGLPMYNFGIPSVFKSYIDHISRSGRTFVADDTGFHGQVTNLKVVVLNSRGGSYKDKATKAMDFVEPYISLIFGFLGITDITFMNIEPTDFYGPEARKMAIQEVNAKIDAFMDKL
ncbi:NAD(P)H-dependent oxidoreductase [Muricauda sp. SCSIO 64092]|uniref:FMN-dependent NADH-azoreductase n=1 Tax=Allomuricauda sp. SCSIO 64092 TaxID=2908842 RepID=UPI001FF675E5|nr:NAD(P)H-dependent oxidoreductase [Muricauda sp. SCSIO 64092]UOY05356.1 NAD(P)H-dependent oxidoreductase [Muricauda sp. SCSIO 64092]